jgi:hypothetical protein
VALDVLQVIDRLAVDVPRKVEVELVSLDLREGDHARVFRYGESPVEDVYDLVDVHVAQAVLWAVLHEAVASVDHEDTLAGLRLFLVDDHDAGGNAGAVKDIGGQADDALDVPLADESAADIGLGVAAEKHAVRQDARSLAGCLERADNVQQVAVVALFRRRHPEGHEATERVVQRVEAVAPALVGEGRIGNDVVEGLESVAVHEERHCQRAVSSVYPGSRTVVQDHVHSGESSRRNVLLLPVERDGGAGLVSYFQEQRAGTTGWIVNGGGRARLRAPDSKNLRHDAADLGGGVELALALATLGGEVPHQVFIGIAEDVVALGAVPGEVEGRVLEDGDQVGEPVHHLLAAAELGGVVEVREVGKLVSIGQWGNDLLVDLVADVASALEGDHVLEGGARRDLDRREATCVFVANVLHEKQNEDVVLVLAGIHATAQLIAALPERAIEL